MPITDGFMLGQVIRYTVLEYLNELIEQGIEYPNALYIASKKYKVHPEDLQTVYDNQFGDQAWTFKAAPGLSLPTKLT